MRARANGCQGIIMSLVFTQHFFFGGIGEMEEYVLADMAFEFCSGGGQVCPVPAQLLVDLGGHAELELPQGGDVVLEHQRISFLEEQLDGIGQVGCLAEKR